ncbi:MAG: hypothetical protein H7A25_10795 [Leptospiraceae bacterium]|nr:hypothetical protein [Leptospiraceae bacterium]MCP5500382.1 hypothetical protein [Leptospiraceae bacterium]
MPNLLKHYKLTFSIFLLFTFSLLASDKLPSSLSEKIWENIYAEDWKEARKVIIDNYKEYSGNIDILSLYEIVLNGQGKKENAAKIRKKILRIWNEKHKDEYVKANYPLNLSHYLRQAVIHSHYLILASEFFLPYPINSSREGFYYHKIIVYNRKTRKAEHLYKLEKSKFTEENFILYEINSSGTSKKIHSYGKELPEIQEEVKKILDIIK